MLRSLDWVLNLDLLHMTQNCYPPTTELTDSLYISTAHCGKSCNHMAIIITLALLSPPSANITVHHRNCVMTCISCTHELCRRWVKWTEQYVSSHLQHHSLQRLLLLPEASVLSVPWSLYGSCHVAQEDFCHAVFQQRTSGTGYPSDTVGWSHATLRCHTCCEKKISEWKSGWNTWAIKMSCTCENRYKTLVAK